MKNLHEPLTMPSGLASGNPDGILPVEVVQPPGLSIGSPAEKGSWGRGTPRTATASAVPQKGYSGPVSNLNTFHLILLVTLSRVSKRKIRVHLQLFQPPTRSKNNSLEFWGSHFTTKHLSEECCCCITQACSLQIKDLMEGFQIKHH